MESLSPKNKKIKSDIEDPILPDIGDPITPPEIIEPLEYKVKKKRGRPKKTK